MAGFFLDQDSFIPQLMMKPTNPIPMRDSNIDISFDRKSPIF